MCHYTYYAHAETMIRKLLILGMFVAVCLELSQGKPSSQARMMEEYADALIQGELSMSHTIYSNQIALPNIIRAMHVFVPLSIN